MSHVAKQIDIINPKRHIKRGGVLYYYHRSYNDYRLAEQAAHWAYKGTGCDYHIVNEAFTKPQSLIEKFVFGTVPVLHAYHVYLGDPVDGWEW